MKTVVDAVAVKKMADVAGREAARTRRAAQRYKADQRRQWDEAASVLRTWWPAFEHVMQPVTGAMLTHARLGPGAHVVDVASGFGEPALTIARHVGPAGRVVATDLSGAMLETAGERAAAFGVANVDLLQMDAEAPTLVPGRYDAVVCRLGLMFLPDPGAALQRLTSLLVPGGRFVAAVWAPPERNAWLTGALGVLTEFLQLPARPADGPGPFALAGRGRLEGALAGAGLACITRQRVALGFAWPSPAAYAAFHEASPMRRVVEDEPPAQRARAWAAVARAAQARWGGGPLCLPGEVTVVSGTRPVSQAPDPARSSSKVPVPSS